MSITIKVCKKCKNTFDMTHVIEDYPELVVQADYCGTESLTEAQQALMEGSICPRCYEEEN
jgi:ribosomal protein L40E